MKQTKKPETFHLRNKGERDIRRSTITSFSARLAGKFLYKIKYIAISRKYDTSGNKEWEGFKKQNLLFLARDLREFSAGQKVFL